MSNRGEDSGSGGHHRPAIWTRLKSGLSGQVPGAGFESYQNAGAAVYDLMDRVTNRRNELELSKTSPWQADTSTQYQFAFAWNAFVLQTLGDKFIQADYDSDASTSGYLPRVTAEQVMAFYQQVEPWVSRANQAESTPSYRPDVHLPALLPQWAEAEPCPQSHFMAMLTASKAIRDRADIAMATFKKVDSGDENANSLAALNQIMADANTAADYAEKMWLGHPNQEVHEQIEDKIKHALEMYYLAGQVMAMPTLSVAVNTVSPSERIPSISNPGAQFDIWCLTDPASMGRWVDDPMALKSIESMWENDPDRLATLAIASQIKTGMMNGDIVYALDQSGKRLGNYYCCPWSPIYEARRAINLGGRQVNQFQTFIYDVSAEEMKEGGEFKREIFVGNFTPTQHIDYCLGDD